MSDELSTINKISKMITSKDPELVQLGINLYKGKYVNHNYEVEEIKRMLSWKAYQIGVEHAKEFLKELQDYEESNERYRLRREGPCNAKE